ncbi:YihY/virulence factor BrkB family protein [Amorphus coralli]|uniref:YihY/virulence factor BrkB family protein n=1 Tax=Amorphus coralli TaxID=340680 RepID=UPI0003718560|nr:YihY/virulence factor BrkB family protein [Amorphus coralli]
MAFADHHHRYREHMRQLLRRVPWVGATWRVISSAVVRFDADDGWAIASHVALSMLLSLFPFLVILGTLAAMFGSQELATEATSLVFSTWPRSVADAIAGEVSAVLDRPRGSLLTVSFVASIWVASNGIEALRLALNRAYRANEDRGLIFRRLQSLGFVSFGSLTMLAVGVLLVLGPITWSNLLLYAPWMVTFSKIFHLSRFFLAAMIIVVALVAAHVWLPAGRRRFADLLPGIAATLAFWLIGAAGFGYYLKDFANYAATYAGLAGIMTAVVFLYLSAGLLILGAEINAALLRYRSERSITPVSD